MIDKAVYKEELSRMILHYLEISEPTPRQLVKAEQLFLRMRLVYEMNFDPKLSVDEAKCLFLIGHGYTAPEIAKQLKLKLSTVASHQKELRRKLKCRTVAEAVRVGYMLNLISSAKAETNLP